MIIIWLYATLAVIFGLLCLMVKFSWLFAIPAIAFGFLCLQSVRNEE
jgi:hypothetical protein